MNYTKPEVAVLGQAVHVVEQLPPIKGRVSTDGFQPVNPAYDLDE
jgi:hypothetical protein